LLESAAERVKDVTTPEGGFYVLDIAASVEGGGERGRGGSLSG
jgi:hypothetical protein